MLIDVFNLFVFAGGKSDFAVFEDFHFFCTIIFNDSYFVANYRCPSRSKFSVSVANGFDYSVTGIFFIYFAQTECIVEYITFSCFTLVVAC